MAVGYGSGKKAAILKLATRLKGRRGDGAVHGEATKKVTTPDVAATTVDVSDEVKKCLR